MSLDHSFSYLLVMQTGLKLYVTKWLISTIAGTDLSVRSYFLKCERNQEKVLLCLLFRSSGLLVRDLLVMRMGQSVFSKIHLYFSLLLYTLVCFSKFELWQHIYLSIIYPLYFWEHLKSINLKVVLLATDSPSN